MNLRRHLFPALLLILTSAIPCQAHFLWIAKHQPANGQPAIGLHFSEAADVPEPELLDRAAGTDVWLRPAQGPRRELRIEKSDEVWWLRGIENIPRSGVIEASKDFGVIERGGNKFLLKYYAKLYHGGTPADWSAWGPSPRLALDLIPEQLAEATVVRVYWQGQTVKDAEVVVQGPESESVKAQTDSDGRVRVATKSPGAYSIRARHVEPASGELDGKTFQTTRHYVTLTLSIGGTAAANAKAAASAKTGRDASAAKVAWPRLPEGITSFGAAVMQDRLFVYGGHTGKTHEYSRDEQSGAFRSLNLRHADAWHELSSGPKLQGLALVAHGGRLYRVGGFTARNRQGEEHDLWSVSDFAAFDPSRGEWQALAPLPEPRSSHDACVLGHHVCVVGGWMLRGSEKPKWHTTAWRIDLTASNATWQELPPPPFRKRALAVAVHAGKMYALGGITPDGTTTDVHVFDPVAGVWSAGPELLGESRDGFGCSAFEAGGRLVATTMSGQIQRLSADGRTWEVLGKLEHPRTFHRLLPLPDSRLIAVGGTSMKSGKVLDLEVVTPAP